MKPGSDLDLSVIVACRDDEDRVGHLIRRVATHLGQLGLRGEILAADEGSADNTLALLSLVRRDLPELELIPGARPGRGFELGVAQARGRAVVFLDARGEPPLSPLARALERVAAGIDVVAVGGRYPVLHRTRTLRAHGALVHHRDPAALERRLLRRARRLGLAIEVLAPPGHPPTGFARLREAILAPLARF